MAMAVGGGESDEPMMDINTTPLIDVMLVLLIMFIITIPVMTHAVKLDMPQAQPPTEDLVQPEVIDLMIDFDGTILWNGDIVADRPTLEAKLTSAAAQPIQPEFHLRPNKLVTYKHVAGVMASAQRLGITKIGLIGAEQFLD